MGVLFLGGCVKTLKIRCAEAPLPTAPAIVREYERRIETQDLNLPEPKPIEILDMLEYIQLLKDGYITPTGIE